MPASPQDSRDSRTPHHWVFADSASPLGFPRIPTPLEAPGLSFSRVQCLEKAEASETGLVRRKRDTGNVSGSKYLGAHEPWRRHPRPEAQRSMEEAAAAGWYFRELSGHAFGVLKCAAMGDPGACTVTVYTTSGPFDGSETAKVIRQKLRACPHQERLEVPDRDLGRSDDELERTVERLVQAATGLQQRFRAAAAIEMAIEDDDVEEFHGQEEVLVRGDNDAQIAWAELGRPLSPWPPEERIGELLYEAETLINRISRAEIADRLRRRLGENRP